MTSNRSTEKHRRQTARDMEREALWVRAVRAEDRLERLREMLRKPCRCGERTDWTRARRVRHLLPPEMVALIEEGAE